MLPRQRKGRRGPRSAKPQVAIARCSRALQPEGLVMKLRVRIMVDHDLLVGDHTFYVDSPHVASSPPGVMVNDSSVAADGAPRGVEPPHRSIVTGHGRIRAIVDLLP